MDSLNTLLKITHGRQVNSYCHCPYDSTVQTGLTETTRSADRKAKKLWETKKTKTQTGVFPARELTVWKLNHGVVKLNVHSVCMRLYRCRPWTAGPHYHFVFTALLGNVGGDSEVQNNSPSILALHWHTSSSWYNRMMIFFSPRKFYLFPSFLFWKNL